MKISHRWLGVLAIVAIGGLSGVGNLAAGSAAVTAKSAVGAGSLSRVTPTVLSALKMLQHRGTTLKHFTANLEVTVHHLRTDERDINIGKIWYQKTKGGSRFDIRFNMLVVDGAIARRHADHDIVFDGRWLIDRDGAAKIFRKIELVAPGQKFNPLRLGDGPIPIPIGQDPSQVLREFHVSIPVSKPEGHGVNISKKAGNHKQAFGLIHLRLVPRDKKAFDFEQMDFWINPLLQLPVKIKRIDPDGTPTTAVLSKLLVNQPMKHDFHAKVPPAGSGWTVDLEPLKAH